MSSDAIDVNEEVRRAIQSSVSRGVSDHLSSITSPLKNLIDRELEARRELIENAIGESLDSAFTDKVLIDILADSIRKQFREHYLKLVGSGLEHRIKVIANDPVKRAKLTVALDELIRKLMNGEEVTK